MQKAIYYQFKEYCAEWYNPQRVTYKSPAALEQVPRPHHFPSPRSRPRITSAQTSTLKGIAARRSSHAVSAQLTHAPQQNHPITSSARPNSGRGTVRPSVEAVLRLMASSTFVTCCTGRSAGFSPLRIRPALIQFFTSSQRDKEISFFALKEREMVCAV
jgi:hypothetical protein